MVFDRYLFSNYKDHHPTPIKMLINHIQELKLPRHFQNSSTSHYPYTNILTRGMNPKKVHEVI